MTDLTPEGTPTGTSAETSPAGPAGTPVDARAETPAGTTAPDPARGTRARPLSEKAATGGPPDRDTTSGAPVRAPGGDGTTTTAGRYDDEGHGVRRHEAHGERDTEGHGRRDTEDPDRLLPRDVCDRLAGQMRHAVAGFVDGPGAAVEEADRVLEETAARFTEAVTERRRSLRRAWQSTGEGRDGGRDGGSATPNADTEVLRLALRDYRELADRLLSR